MLRAAPCRWRPHTPRLPQATPRVFIATRARCAQGAPSELCSPAERTRLIPPRTPGASCRTTQIARTAEHFGVSAAAVARQRPVLPEQRRCGGRQFAPGAQVELRRGNRRAAQTARRAPRPRPRPRRAAWPGVPPRQRRVRQAAFPSTASWRTPASSFCAAPAPGS